MNHLDSDIIPLLDLPDKDRIEYVRTSKFIRYQQALEILDKFSDLLTFPKDRRMRNYLLIGETNNGKTSILDEFVSKFEVRNDPGIGPRLDVFYFRAPSKADESRLYGEILKGLNVAHNNSDTVSNKLEQVRGIIESLGIKVLVMDELHSIVSGTARMQRNFLITLKTLSNDLQISLIFAGTPEALDVITYDPQLANRFPTLRLESWSTKPAEFIAFLKAYERKLPLKKASNLVDRKLAALIFKLGEGLIGEYCTIIKDAAVAAIRSGEEKITIQIIENLKFEPPSKRSVR